MRGQPEVNPVSNPIALTLNATYKVLDHFGGPYVVSENYGDGTTVLALSAMRWCVRPGPRSQCRFWKMTLPHWKYLANVPQAGPNMRHPFEQRLFLIPGILWAPSSIYRSNPLEYTRIGP